MSSVESPFTAVSPPAVAASASRRRTRDAFWPGAVAASCLLAALIVTWPLPMHLATAVPRGTELEATVPLLNIWTMWWNADRAAHLFSQYWHAPFFFPFPGVFAFSEPQPLIGVPFAPLWGLGFPPALIYNLALLAILVLNGVFGYRLARAIELPQLPALLGGLLTITLPFVANMLGVIHLVPLFGMLWTLEGFVRFGRGGETRHVAWAGAGLLATFLMSLQYGLMFVPFVGLAALLALAQRSFSAASVLRVAVAGVVSAAVVLLLVWPAFSLHAALGLSRPEWLVQILSAEAADFFTRPATAWLTLPSRSWDDTAGLFPGLVLFGLALAGAVLGLRKSGRRRWTLYLVLTGAGAFLLAMGLNLQAGGLSPFMLLRDGIPGFAELRSPFRFTAIMQMVLPLLAAIALAQIQPRASRAAGAGLALLALLAMAENLAIPGPLVAVPATPRTGWTTWLREQSPHTVVAHVPFPGGVAVSDYEIEGRRLLAQTDHGKLMVNGYSGYLPPGYADFQLDMARRFPTQDLLCELAEGVEVNTLVVDQSWLAAHRSQLEAHAAFVQPAYTDDEVQIYHLQAPDGVCVPRPGQP